MSDGFVFDNENGIIWWNGQLLAAVGGVVSGRTYSCPAVVAVGDAVANSGSGSVDRADASVAGLRPCIGFCRFKPTATSCLVQYYGELDGYGGALTADMTYYLDSSPGGITTVAPGGGDLVQAIGQSRSSSILLIQIDPDFILTA